MRRKQKNVLTTSVLAIILHLVIFLCDVNTELGIATGVAYVAPLIFLTGTNSPKHLLVAAVTSSILIFVGYMLSPDSSEFHHAVANRILCVFAVWVVCVASIRLNAIQAIIRSSDESRQQIRNSSPDALVNFDRSGKIVAWNPAAARVFGWPEEEVIGTSFANVISDLQDVGESETDFENVLNERLPGVFSSRVDASGVRRNGERFPAEVRIVRAVGDAEPKYTAFVRDVLEYQKHEVWFKLLLESTGEAIYGLDTNGVCTFCNPSCVSTLGYDSPEDLLGKNMHQLIHHKLPDGSPYAEVDCRIYSALQRREKLCVVDEVFWRADGTSIPVEYTSYPLLQNGELLGAVVAFLDITDRRRAQEELQRVNAELEVRQQETEEFVYTISHDLKSPLVTMRGFLGVLQDDAAAGNYADMADSIQRIKRASGNMQRLLDDLLQLSRVGMVRDMREWIDLNMLLAELRDDLESRLSESGAQFIIQEEIPSIHADRLHMRQVFENLIANAVKYGTTAPNPVIEVGGSIEGERIQLFVRDNGDGIPPEDQERIFQVFHRLPSDQDGTGMGLAIVRGIIRRHGGTVRVESKYGCGAEFIISLPSRPMPESESSSTNSGIQRLASTTPTRSIHSQ